MQLAFFFHAILFFSNFVFCSSIKPALEPLKNAKIFTPLCKSDTTKCATVIWNWEFHSEIIWLNQDIFWNLHTLWFVNDSAAKTRREPNVRGRFPAKCQLYFVQLCKKNSWKPAAAGHWWVSTALSLTNHMEYFLWVLGTCLILLLQII